MPKQIKKKELPAGEKKNAVLGVIVMLAAFAFGGTILGLTSVLEKGGTAGTALGIAVACCLALFLAVSLWHCIQGIITFEKQENYGVLLTSVLTAFSAFACILNVQMALSLFFAAIGMEDLSKSVIGDRSFDTFMATQRTAWIIMIFGVAAGVGAGLAAMSKLSRNAR